MFYYYTVLPIREIQKENHNKKTSMTLRFEEKIHF